MKYEVPKPAAAAISIDLSITVMIHFILFPFHAESTGFVGFCSVYLGPPFISCVLSLSPLFPQWVLHPPSLLIRVFIKISFSLRYDSFAIVLTLFRSIVICFRFSSKFHYSFLIFTSVSYPFAVFYLDPSAIFYLGHLSI